ncbi:MAG: hypothetical protein AAGM67_11120 [Bacteroidota bacterium]
MQSEKVPHDKLFETNKYFDYQHLSDVDVELRLKYANDGYESNIVLFSSTQTFSP